MKTTKTFVLAHKIVAPRPAPKWEFFKGREEDDDESVEFTIAVKKGRASTGDSVDADNIREDKGNNILFLKDARQKGEKKIVARPPTGTSKKQKRRKKALPVVDKSGKKSKKQRKKEAKHAA